MSWQRMTHPDGRCFVHGGSPRLHDRFFIKEALHADETPALVCEEAFAVRENNVRSERSHDTRGIAPYGGRPH